MDPIKKDLILKFTNKLSFINEITFFRLKQKKVFYVPEKKFFLGNYIFLIQFYILLKVIKKNKVFFYFLSKKQNRTRSTQYVIHFLEEEGDK